MATQRDNSIQGEFKLAQFAAQLRPFYKEEMIQRLRAGLQQVLMRDPSPVFFPVSLAQQGRRVAIPQAGLPFVATGPTDFNEGTVPDLDPPSGDPSGSGSGSGSGSSGESGISGSGASGESGLSGSGSGSGGSGSGSGGSGSGPAGWDETTDQNCLEDGAISCRAAFGVAIGMLDCPFEPSFPPQNCPITRGAATYCACWTDQEASCGEFDPGGSGTYLACLSCNCDLGNCPYYTAVCCYDDGTIEVLFPSCCCSNVFESDGPPGEWKFDNHVNSSQVLTIGF